MSSELAATAEMTAMQAQIFDGIRPSGARLFLLKRGEQTKRFVVVAEITSGWFATFDREFRDEMKVSIAAQNSAIENQIGQSSFLGYGIGSSGDEIDVFSFDKKDAIRPHATSPSWKLHTKREANERFIIP